MNENYYTLKISLDINNKFACYRTITIPSSISFDLLHKILVNLFGYSGKKTYNFILERDKWLRAHKTIENAKTMDPIFITKFSLPDASTVLDDIIKDYKKFIWEYDISAQWDHFVELIETNTDNSQFQIIDFAGDNPKEEFICPAYYEDSLLKGLGGITFNKEKTENEIRNLLQKTR